MFAFPESHPAGTLRRIVILTLLLGGAVFGTEAEAGILLYDADRVAQEPLSSLEPPNLMGAGRGAELHSGLDQRSTDGMAGCSARGPDLEVVADQVRRAEVGLADLQFRLLLSRSVICIPEVILGIFRPPECNVLLDFRRC